MRFVKSTGTGDKRKAQVIANQYVAGWKILIEQALGAEDKLLAKAVQWREEIEKIQDFDQREAFESRLYDEVESIEKSKGLEFATQVYGVAMGTSTLTRTSYEQWRVQLTLEPKTVDQMTRDVGLFESLLIL